MLLTPEAGIAALDREICELSFAEFLTYCSIRSDDPLAPGVVPLTPWPFQVERAESWQAGTSEVILKERQLGFSAVLVAPYMLWRAMYHGWACGYLSVGQAEAREEIQRIKALYASLPSHLRVAGTIRADDAEFRGGGRIIAFPSTEHAGISYTLQLVVMDEAAFHPYGGANYAAIQPAASLGQFIILSTADPSLGPSGFFHDMYWASKRGETPYTAVFVARCRPDRDVAWYRRARSAYVGRYEEFDAFYPETDASAFVARSGLVYPQFTEARHVRVERIPIVACTRIVAGVDWGGGDPTAVTIMGLEPRQHAHQYAEFSKRGTVGVDEIAGFISQYPARQVRCGADEPVAIATLQKALGPSYDVQAADTRRAEGLGLVAFLLTNDRLTIDPSCRQSIAEFPGYRWAEHVDPNDRQRYATKTPVDHHADLHDARRYAVAELLALLMEQSSLPKRTIGGRAMSRSAV